MRLFAQLRRLGFGLVTISHANLVSLIRIARPSAHHSNDTRDRFFPPVVSALQGAPVHRLRAHRSARLS
jgi:hypothetical protein